MVPRGITKWHTSDVPPCNNIKMLLTKVHNNNITWPCTPVVKGLYICFNEDFLLTLTRIYIYIFFCTHYSYKQNTIIYCLTCAMVFLAASSTCSRSDTSQQKAWAWPPSARTSLAVCSQRPRSRSHRANLAPSALSCSASSRPIPWPAPVICIAQEKHNVTSDWNRD